MSLENFSLKLESQDELPKLQEASKEDVQKVWESIKHSIKLVKTNDVLQILDFPDNIEESFRKILDKQTPEILKDLSTKSKKEILVFLNSVKKQETLEVKENYSYKKNESSSSSNNNYSNNEQDNKKQRQYKDFRNSNSNNEYSSYESNESNQNYESNDTYEKVEENENIFDEFKRFYSSSAYIILGVSENDDFSHIKKSYRALVSIYHPDKKLDEIELYTEITQNINSAYDKLKKIKGK